MEKDVEYLKNCIVYCIGNEETGMAESSEEYKEVMDRVLRRLEQLERQIEIKNAYLDMIYDVGIDYDGCNTIKSLKELIDEFMKWAKFAMENNDTECMFIGANDKEFNILHEELLSNGKLAELIDKHFDNITPEEFNEAVKRCMEGLEDEI